MPFNVVAERSVIIGMLRSEGLRKQALLTLSPEHFEGGKFRILFEAIGECEAKRIRPDAAAILQITDGQDAGGLEFLNILLGQEVPENFGFHLSSLKDGLHRRTAIQILPKIAQKFEDNSQDIDSIYAELHHVYKAREKDLRSEKVGFSENYCNHFDKRCSSNSNFQPTGIASLDHVLNEGFSKETTSIIAARTGNGKTTTMVDIVRRRLQGVNAPKIAVFPLEIGQVRFLDKLVSSITGIPTVKMRKLANELTLAERDKIKETVRELEAGERLVVYDNPFIELDSRNNDAALDKLESLLALSEADIVFLDLFQRILVDIRPASVELALRRVQNMAQEYRSHICMLHQISRKAEERKDKRPELEDLKGSGGYEEFPDLILFLHRPKAHKQFRIKDEIEINPMKQREGDAHLTIVADFHPDISRLSNDHFAASQNAEEEEPY